MNPTNPSRLAICAVFSCAFLALFLTRWEYGFAIDEASYVWVAEQERLWFSEIPERGFWQSVSHESLTDRWHFLEPPGSRAGHSNFNLPLAQHLLNVTWVSTYLGFHELTAYRLSSMLLFAIAAAMLYGVFVRRFGVLAAVSASALLIANPRVFGHAHLATTETPLSVFWLLTLLSLLSPSDADSKHGTWRHAVLVGALLSCTMSVKLTGWLLAPVVGLWLIVVRPSGWWRMLTCCVLMPVPILIALTPPLWHAPFSGLIQYIQAASQNPWKIASYFDGQGYRGGQPWWSVGWVILTTVPVSILVLSSALPVFRSRWRECSLFAFAALMLVGVRAMGKMPQHDVERQFLPVFYCLSAMAGIALASLARTLLNWFGQRQLQRFGLAFAVPIIVCTFAEPFWELTKYRNHGLCYYNSVVGGFPGAARSGMELTYWWETVRFEDWHYFLDDLPRDAKVFLRPDHPGLEYLKRWNCWRDDLRSVGPQESEFTLLYAKRAAYLVPDQNDELRPTDLLFKMERAPSLKERRFLGVRLAALFHR